MKKSQLKEIIREMIAQELEEGRIDQLRTKVDTAIKNDPTLVARKNTIRRISQQYAGASPDEKIPTNFGLAHTTPARVRDDAIKSWGKKPQKVSEQIRKKMAHDLKNESLRNKLYDPEFRKKYIDDMNKQYGIKPKSAPAGDGNKSTPPKDKEKTKN